MNVIRPLNRGARLLLEVLGNKAPRAAAYGLVSRLAPFALGRKGRRLAGDTRSAFPDRQPEWIADVVRRQQIHRAWVALDRIVLSSMTDEEILELVDPQDVVAARSVIDEALDGGKGCLMLSLHLGRPLLGMRLFPLLGYPCTVLVAGTTRSLFEGGGRGSAIKRDIEFLQANDKSSARRIVRALGRNRLVFVLLDGGIAIRRCNARFLGRDLSIPDAVPRFAQMSGAAVIAAVILTEQPLRFRVRLDAVEPGRSDESPRELADRMLTPLEAAVLQDPGQFYGINRMFRDSTRAQASDLAGESPADRDT
ncbi:MAG: hypothetical protein IT175_07735 [Acidobacteria bacterium]|nr:hypothetical protein [Acidobacteriota bacterium]